MMKMLTATNKAKRSRKPSRWFAAALCLVSYGLMPTYAYPLTANTDLTDLSLEQLLLMEIEVVSASKFAQKSTEAPSAVQIIRANEIRRNGWKTLTEALSSLPGIYTSENGAYDFLGTRGFLIPGDYGTRFLLLIDGKPNNDNIFQQALFGSEGWLDILNIERIEYVPGPGSSIYGSNAVFGAVNIITRQATPLPVTQAHVSVTQDGGRGINAMTSRKIDGTSLLLSFSQNDKAGRDKTYDMTAGALIRGDGTPSPDGVAHDLGRQSNQQFMLRIDREDISFTLINHERKLNPSSPLYLTAFDDPSLQLVDGGTSLNLNVQHKISDTVSSSFRLGYTDFYYRSDYPSYDAGIGYYHSYDDTQGRILDGEARLLIQLGAHRLLTGIELSKDLIARQVKIDLGDPTLDFDINQPRQRTGLFIQDEWRLLPSLIANVGLRLDQRTDSPATRSPRLGLIWQANDAWTLKLLGGKSYRLPSQFEMYYGTPNPDLKPESIRTVEIVSEWRSNRQTRWQMSAYDNRINNLISKSDTLAENLNGAHTRGVELGLIHESIYGLLARSSLSVNQAHDDLGQKLTNSPNWLGKISISAPFFEEKLLLAGELHGIGTRIHNWNNTTYHLPAQILGRLVLTVPNITGSSTGKTSAQLSINNLFNHAANYPVSAVELSIPFVPQEGRTLLFTLTHDF